MTNTPGSEPAERKHAQLVRDLERRIDVLNRASDSDVGEFTQVDWFLCVAGFMLAPYLLYLWFRP